jgi:hypothetical protein
MRVGSRDPEISGEDECQKIDPSVNQVTCGWLTWLRIGGTRWRNPGFMHDREYTIKLEGVRRVGYSTILMGGVRDPYILAQIDRWLAQFDDNIKTRIRNTVGERAYEIVTRVYGRDGVMGALEPQRTGIHGKTTR